MSSEVNDGRERSDVAGSVPDEECRPDNADQTASEGEPDIAERYPDGEAVWGPILNASTKQGRERVTSDIENVVRWMEYFGLREVTIERPIAGKRYRVEFR